MKSFLTGVILLLGTSVFACDHCGIYLNMRPNDFSHFVGIFYGRSVYEGFIPNTNKSLLLRHGDEVVREEFQGYTLADEFQYTELRARYAFNQKWFAWGRLPIVENTRYQEGDLISTANGFGDPMVFVGHNLINSKSTDSSLVVNRLELSAGLKFPVGSTQVMYGEDHVDHDMQPGTGSYDALFSANYIAFIQRVGISNQAIFRLNGANLSNYSFGNTFRDNLAVMVKANYRYWTFLPQVGVSGDWIGADVENDVQLENSGGVRYLWSAGMEINYKNVSIQGVYMKPFHQDLKGVQFPQQNALYINLKYFI